MYYESFLISYQLFTWKSDEIVELCDILVDTDIRFIQVCPDLHLDQNRLSNSNSAILDFRFGSTESGYRRVNWVLHVCLKNIPDNTSRTTKTEKDDSLIQWAFWVIQTMDSKVWKCFLNAMSYVHACIV